MKVMTWELDALRERGLDALELTHVEQQARGRVSALTRVGGVDVNEQPALERASDAIGERAAAGSIALSRSAPPKGGG